MEVRDCDTVDGRQEDYIGRPSSKQITTKKKFKEHLARGLICNTVLYPYGFLTYTFAMQFLFYFQANMLFRKT